MNGKTARQSCRLTRGKRYLTCTNRCFITFFHDFGETHEANWELEKGVDELHSLQ